MGTIAIFGITKVDIPQICCYALSIQAFGCDGLYPDRRLTRVERTKYEIGGQQRSETEWKFGMDTRLRTHSWAAGRRKPSTGN